MQTFFVSERDIENGKIVICGEDAKHLSFSLRMKVGDKICVCTPDKMKHVCAISSFSEGRVECKILESELSGAEMPCRVMIYQALPKGDKFDTVVQKAVECGAYSITPFVSERCIAKPGDSFSKKLERWNRISREASKQCGRGIVPSVEPLLSFDEMLKRASEAELPLFCYEGEKQNKLGRVISNDCKTISVVVGSEGGFSPDEANAAEKAGLVSVGLGPRILRCETASSFVLACISLEKELK